MKLIKDIEEQTDFVLTHTNVAVANPIMGSKLGHIYKQTTAAAEYDKEYSHYQSENDKVIKSISNLR